MILERTFLQDRHSQEEIKGLNWKTENRGDEK